MADARTIKDAVKDKYGAIAEGRTSVCCEPGTSCDPGSDQLVSLSSSYTADELASVPKEAALGLGCGNPTGEAEIKHGEVVVDLGSGAGIDCFLAARKVGERGLVIGVDMTDAMLDKARANAAEAGVSNVEFRKGEIESMPIDADSVDLVVSNCVINLAPDKERVFREICRVLKPGGRFCVSDVVSKGEIPSAEREDMESWAGCIAGAMKMDDYLALVRQCGFVDLDVKGEVDYDYKRTEDWSIASLTLMAYKPTAV